MTTVWRHVKSGGLYRLLHGDALLEENLRRYVVYECMQTGQVWLRPRPEFLQRFVFHKSVKADSMRTRTLWARARAFRPQPFQSCARSWNAETLRSFTRDAASTTHAQRRSTSSTSS